MLNVGVPPIDISPQLQYYKDVTFDVNYEDTTNAEDYVCEDPQMDEGNQQT